MIYICYGITKSASTFLYQLTEEVLRASGRPVIRLGKPFRKFDSVENYFDFIDGELLVSIERHTGGADIVLKTHGPLYDDVAVQIANGAVLASASIRDPREIALAMIDHGARSRRWREKAFVEFTNVQDTFNALDIQIDLFRRWAELDQIKIFNYNEICFNTHTVVTAIVDQIGLQVDSAQVTKSFSSKAIIGQFSTGKAERYRDMPLTEQKLFLERYADFYARFPFDTLESRKVAVKQASRALHPRGGLGQALSTVLRLLRR